jgi:hypothetical protein
MTSEVNSIVYKKLQEISVFLKGNEFCNLLSDFPKRSKFVQWITSETVQVYLEEDIDFFDGLSHNFEKPFRAKVKKHSRVISSHCNNNLRHPTLFGFPFSTLISLIFGC